MLPAKFLTAVAAVPIFSSLTAALDVQSKTNVAVYYGQGANQKRLSHFCEETSLDIINIGFVNIFPDQSLTGWPGSNFGNQCDGLTFTIGGLTSGLLSGCHQLEEDIPKCQAAGKIVMLSLGGAYPMDQEIKSEESALAFADFLWGAFGPKIDDWIGVNGPRPFGDVVVDGFDFDIEHNGGFGYATMINRFRWHFAHYPERKFYISGAPQCSIPDPQLSDAIQNAAFDFIWVQFYNTVGCSARNFVDGTGNPGFNFDQWVEVIKKGGNPSAKLFVGLPASPHAANPGFYLTPAEVRPLITKYMGLYPETFGGVMLWEATASDLNRIAGGSYADNMKRIFVFEYSHDFKYLGIFEHHDHREHSKAFDCDNFFENAKALDYHIVHTHAEAFDYINTFKHTEAWEYYNAFEHTKAHD
ncbi:hypothetical protein VTN00DRAFT_6318 [Thermoascus crustaceus]|uniref:uncharacterized protein n=1 Tax=Thermoascus crustaceus TaxID=5088 RepID=UPI003742EEBA